MSGDSVRCDWMTNNSGARNLLGGVVVLVLLLGFSGLGFAQPPETATLAPELETRARTLGLELKCPVCQGSAIAESPSEFARSMMVELRSQIRAGKSDEQITQYFVSRYGEDVRLKPSNPLIWILPGAVVLFGAVGLISYLRRASKNEPLEVNAAALERVRQELRSAEGES
jgi:cytochrome c-type biogenesis protein CcmH